MVLSIYIESYKDNLKWSCSIQYNPYFAWKSDGTLSLFSKNVSMTYSVSRIKAYSIYLKYF
jgi:hypothetical protein